MCFLRGVSRGTVDQSRYEERSPDVPSKMFAPGEYLVAIPKSSAPEHLPAADTYRNDGISFRREVLAVWAAGRRRRGDLARGTSQAVVLSGRCRWLRCVQWAADWCDRLAAGLRRKAMRRAGRLECFWLLIGRVEGSRFELALVEARLLGRGGAVRWCAMRRSRRMIVARTGALLGVCTHGKQDQRSRG